MSLRANTRFKKIKGTREQVWAGVAKETSSGLQKKDLMVSKSGSLVSKKASNAAKDRMKSGEGFCGYCIKIYKEGKIKNKSNKSIKKSTKKKSSKKKLSKKSVKKLSKKKSTKKKSVKKKSESKLKVKKPKGVTLEKVEELKKEIEKIREKAGRIAEREGKMTKEVTKLLELVTKKTKEMIAMKRVLKEKK